MLFIYSFIYLLHVFSRTEQQESVALATPRSWVQFPGNAWTDKYIPLIQVTLNKRYCPTVVKLNGNSLTRPLHGNALFTFKNWMTLHSHTIVFMCLVMHFEAEGE